MSSPAPRDLVAPEEPGLERLAGIEDERRGIGDRAPGPHHVEVLVHAFPRLGVVVIEIEGVGLRLLQEIHDVAGLGGALAQPGGCAALGASAARAGAVRARTTSDAASGAGVDEADEGPAVGAR